MGCKVVRPKLHVAVLDKVYDTVGDIDKFRICIRLSDCQRPGHKLDASLYSAILAFDVEPCWTERTDQLHSILEWEGFAYILGPETVSWPKDVSGGRIEVSRYCLLMFAVALWSAGVNVGAAG